MFDLPPVDRSDSFIVNDSREKHLDSVLQILCDIKNPKKYSGLCYNNSKFKTKGKRIIVCRIVRLCVVFWPPIYVQSGPIFNTQMNVLEVGLGTVFIVFRVQVESSS